MNLTFDTAIKIAMGCRDYCGGYRKATDYEIYQHGIQTVINALKAAAKNPDDTQTIVLFRIGNKEQK